MRHYLANSPHPCFPFPATAALPLPTFQASNSPLSTSLANRVWKQQQTKWSSAIAPIERSLSTCSICHRPRPAEKGDRVSCVCWSVDAWHGRTTLEIATQRCFVAVRIQRDCSWPVVKTRKEARWKLIAIHSDRVEDLTKSLGNKS